MEKEQYYIPTKNNPVYKIYVKDCEEVSPGLYKIMADITNLEDVRYSHSDVLYVTEKRLKNWVLVKEDYT